MIIAFFNKIMKLFLNGQLLGMAFNVRKCFFPISKKLSTRIFQNSICGGTLECVDDHEYLGTTISHDLRLERHCNKIAIEVNKTRSILVMLVKSIDGSNPGCIDMVCP